jgi:hypothetical protein
MIRRGIRPSGPRAPLAPFAPARVDSPWSSHAPAYRGRLAGLPPPRHSRAPPAHVALKAYVANVYVKYFRCSRGMLQVFHMDVVKVDLNVAYVASVYWICFRCLLKMIHLLQIYAVNVLSGCCICCSGYTYMLQVYIPNVLSALDICCRKCFHVVSVS